MNVMNAIVSNLMAQTNKLTEAYFLLQNSFSPAFTWLFLAFTAIGLLFVLKFAVSLFWLSYVDHFLSGINLKKRFGSKQKYALITGSTDGIGKEFAMQFAKLGINVVLVSRTERKLKAVAAEISEKYPSIDVKYLAIDFSKASPEDYQEIKNLASRIPISILVNNVAMNHDIPTPFVEESTEVLDNIVNVNIGATLKVTQALLRNMVDRKEGLIINIGSFAGMVPTPFLQTYSGSKAFLKFWSLALADEVRPFNVHVEHLNTYFVVSNMSKIRRPSLMIPSANVYARSAIKKIGVLTDFAPYSYHNLMAWVLNTIVPARLLRWHTYNLQVDIRKRALRKREKLANKKGN